jgi:sensor c-di-GMP phosphodiesterase-like protein
MNYLKNLPVDTIKIDKSFIDDILKDKSDAAIVVAIIQLSRSLNYDTIAEGIETTEQEEMLVQLDCFNGQGYLFSKGLIEEEFIEFLKKQQLR